MSGHHAYVADEFSGLRTDDVADPVTPVLLDTDPMASPLQRLRLASGIYNYRLRAGNSVRQGKITLLK